MVTNMIKSINVHDIKFNDCLIIDIRSKEKYDNGHIPNSNNIPFEQLIAYPNKFLNINKTYYIYCQRGIQSKNACLILSSKGYNVINIIGGYSEWLKLS